MKVKWIRLKARIRNLRETILRSIDLKRSKLYQVFFFDSNDRRQLGRIRTRNEGLIFEFIKYVMVKAEHRHGGLEDEGIMLFDTAPPCKECESSEFEDKDQCLLEGECNQDTSFGIEWFQIEDKKEEREFRLITGENLYWDLTLLTKTELKLLELEPEENWVEADKKCRASNWHCLTEKLGLDGFFKKLGAEHQGDLDSLIEEETTGFGPAKRD